MSIEISAHAVHHLLGETATHLIEPRFGLLAALLLVAGMSPPSRHALPSPRITAHSGAFKTPDLG